MTLHISNGNQKMGNIPSFSLPAGLTCCGGRNAPCFEDCYAERLAKIRPSVREAYEDNLRMLNGNMKECEKFLHLYFDGINSPRLFRIHVSGDFYSTDYMRMWLRIADSHPHTQFMAFTKQFDVVKLFLESIPENFTLIASAWPGVPLPKWVECALPIAYMQDGTETRIPESAHVCEGDCSGCCRGYCWSMKPGDAVVLPKH